MENKLIEQEIIDFVDNLITTNNVIDPKELQKQTINQYGNRISYILMIDIMNILKVKYNKNPKWKKEMYLVNDILRMRY